MHCTTCHTCVSVHHELTSRGELPGSTSPGTPSKAPKTLPGVYNVLKVNGHRGKLPFSLSLSLSIYLSIYLSLSCKSILTISLAEGESVNMSKRVSCQDREGSPGGEVRPPFPMFTGPERQLGLKLCGWSFGNDGQSLEDYLKRCGFGRS